MTEKTDQPKKLVLKGDKKLLENPVMGSLMVPIAIVLVGALVIFGVTKMLSTETSYKDHVRELQSKTFGNKWIAAFELSKKIASSQIPNEDLPWLIENLSDVYKNSPDGRTRDFVVVALGALKHESVLPWLTLALEDESADAKFHAIVAIGNMENVSNMNWKKVEKFFSDEDHALRQAVVLAAGTHRVKELENLVVARLTDESVSVRYAAATSLVYYKNEQGLGVISDILFNSHERGFDVNQQMSLKLNVLNAIGKIKWERLKEVVQRVVNEDNNLKVTTKAQEVLISLKN